jgi:hypothetical protein
VKEDIFLDHDQFVPAQPPKAPAHPLMPVAMLVLGLAALGAVYAVGSSLMARRAVPAPSETVAWSATPDDLTKRSLTAFVEQFLMAYYCYSAGPAYDSAVKRAESMMTPAFLAAYNQKAEDLEFKRKLAALKVGTQAIRILPGSVSIGNAGDRYFVRLSGTMTFTTGVNGASGDFPLNLLLAIQRTDSGFLVDNVERLR